MDGNITSSVESCGSTKFDYVGTGLPRYCSPCNEVTQQQHYEFSSELSSAPSQHDSDSDFSDPDPILDTEQHIPENTCYN